MLKRDIERIIHRYRVSPTNTTLTMLNWIRNHKFQAHLTAFLLMVISSIGMLLIRQDGAGFAWLLIAVFTAANILALFIK